MRPVHRRRALRAALALPAAGLALALPARGAAARPFAPDVIVTVRPEPSIYVERGGQLTYELRARKVSRGTVYRVRVTLPFSPAQLTLLGSSFTAEDDWVSDRASGRVTVQFARASSSRVRVARLTFRVNEQLPDNTVLPLRASYAWDDGSAAPANAAPVLVGNLNAHDPHVWVSADPVSGRAGTRHRFLSDRFVPGEEVATWLNTPGGIVDLRRRLEADSEGVVRFELLSGGLRPGAHSLVFQGIGSELTGVAPFIVE